MIYICKICNEKFKDTLSANRQFCSNKCRAERQKEDFKGDKSPRWKHKKHICFICNKLFDLSCTTSKQKYCSQQCSGIAKKKGQVRNCIYCNKEFIARPHSPQSACSVLCSNRFKAENNLTKLRNGAIKKCEHYQQEFYVSQSEINRKFCVHLCYLLSRYKEIKPHYICKTCGKTISKRVWNKKYCSMKCRNIDPDFYLWRKGESHHNWKGGVTSENKKARKVNKYKEWQMSVFERDNYTCQRCKARDIYLHAHHIKSFADHSHLRYEINNGITLCMYCHQEIHPNIKGIVGYKDVQQHRLSKIQKTLFT